MAITFPRVHEVEPGTPVSSLHLARIADALNARDRSGLGDTTYRRVAYLFSMLRGMRNPDSSGFLFPAQAEFFQQHQQLKASEASWPVAGPGDPEGANLASVLPLFVFGAAAANLDSEDLRIADEFSGGVPLWFGMGPPASPEEHWELGKLQRGSIDPTTGALASPSFRAAIEHLKVRHHLNSPHGNSWGGYMPAPVRLGDCADPINPNYEIKFTRLSDSFVVAYSGTCPEDPTHIAGISETSRYFYVFFNDPLLPPDVFPRNEWIQGPYEGGAWVMRQSGGHIPRVLNAFVNDFRGTEAQREEDLETDTWLEHAFDVQRFLTTQYHLAPQIGTESEDDVIAAYPRWEATGSPGTIIGKVGGGSSHAYTAGFVLTAALVKCEGLVGTAEIEFLDGTDVIKTVTVTADGSGNYAGIVIFDAATPVLSVRWGTTATFASSSGLVVIEANEIMEYKPELHDLYLCLRLGSCRTTLVGGMDGSGTLEESANEISDAYFANACITNVHGEPGPAGSTAEINSNAVFDAARRLSKSVRILPRQNFIGYEVSGGKSISYFTRLGPGGVDLFEGIAPSRDPVTAIAGGRTYIVRSGSITYMEVEYVAGQTFAGNYSVSEYTGDGEVYEYEGIIATAPREGWTNEWQMGQQLKVYHPSESSIWKEDAYADIFFLNERCHFYPSILPTDLRWQFGYSPDLPLVTSESPTGWRYAKNTNTFGCTEGDTGCEERRRNRYKSCRIYEPDPEIESATVLIESGTEVVKLVFKTRFHHHEAAPASIGRDVGTWNLTDLQSEASEYRTVENGLREYLVYQATGNQCTPGAPFNGAGQGNAASNSIVWGTTDNPYGACYPYFYFTKLMPKPYEDGNTSQESHDTPLWSDWWAEAELRIRVMCEGFVDDLTSSNIGCLTGVNALFCFTFESLCFKAFGGRWFNTLATQTTDYLESTEVRTDAPQGFGQLQNCSLSSEIYNQFAAAINELVRVPVLLPIKFEVRNINGSENHPVDAIGNGAPVCTSTGTVRSWWTGTPPDPGASAADAWGDGLGISSSVFAGIVCDDCAGDQWILTTSRTNGEWRWRFQDPDAQYAVPEAWRDMPESGAGRLLAFRITQTKQLTVEAVPFEESDACVSAGGHWFDGTNYYRFVETTLDYSEECVVLPASGTIEAPPLGAQDIPIGRTAAIEANACCGGIQNSSGVEPILGQDTAFIEIPLV